LFAFWLAHDHWLASYPEEQFELCRSSIVVVQKTDIVPFLRKGKKAALVTLGHIPLQSSEAETWLCSLSRSLE
jgi:hypothetical protein